MNINKLILWIIIIMYIIMTFCDVWPGAQQWFLIFLMNINELKFLIKDIMNIIMWRNMMQWAVGNKAM